jgi:hypothetical protein
MFGFAIAREHDLLVEIGVDGTLGVVHEVR